MGLSKEREHYHVMEDAKDSRVIVIFDGECRFCRACLIWLERKLSVKALAYQDIDPGIYGLTYEQCSKELHARIDNQASAGALAVSALLQVRGNHILASLIQHFPRLSGYGYRWVATHRSSLVIRSATKILERVNRQLPDYEGI